MNEYTFPFNTCEKINKNGIAQPYSSLFKISYNKKEIYDQIN